MKKLPTKYLNARKVLPLVYDESLSYYEDICKLTNKINDLITTFNNIIDDTIDEYIEGRINELFVDSIYNAETETLELYITHE